MKEVHYLVDLFMVYQIKKEHVLGHSLCQHKTPDGCYLFLFMLKGYSFYREKVVCERNSEANALLGVHNEWMAYPEIL